MKTRKKEALKCVLCKSISAFALDYNSQCPQKDDDIKPEGPVPDVVFIHDQPFFEGKDVPAAHLPESCKSRLYSRDNVEGFTHFQPFSRQIRPGADKTHFSLENIEKLGRLVEAVFPEELSDFCYARVVIFYFLILLPFFSNLLVLVEIFAQFCVAFSVHCTEFENLKNLALLP